MKTTLETEEEKSEDFSFFDDLDLDDSSARDIFNEFDKALAEYEYQYEQSRNMMKIPDQMNKRSEDEDPVSTLLQTTNDLMKKFQQNLSEISIEMHSVKKLTENMASLNIEDQLNEKLQSLHSSLSNSIKDLKNKMKNEDSRIKQSIELKSEDFSMIRKTTTSRLSVYETRLDTLEQLVFEIKQGGLQGRSEKSIEQRTTLKPRTTTTSNPFSLHFERYYRTTTARNEDDGFSEQFQDFAEDGDFSMLGLSSLNDLDNLENEREIIPDAFSHKTDPHRSWKEFRSKSELNNVLPALDQGLDCNCGDIKASIHSPGSSLAIKVYLREQ